MKRKKSVKKLAKLEKKYQQLAEQLESANQLNQYYAMWAHEMRTPLWAIQSGLSSLKPSLAGLANNQAWLQLECASSQLVFAVDDLLSLSQLQAGRLRVNPQAFDLSDLVNQVESMVRPLVEQAGLQFELVWDTQSHVGLMGDAFRIKQVLLNLLSNAIKYSQQGKVTLNVGYSNEQLQFRVTDTGCGMDSSALKQLFKPFETFIAPALPTQASSGLGLFMVGQLVSVMQGKIDVNSSVGKGTVFNLSLPMSSTSLEDLSRRPSQAEIKAQKVRVLIADDSALSRQAIIRYLNPREVEWVEAEDGEQALAFLEQHTFDYLFLDQFMPKIEGRELCQQIRQRQRDGLCSSLKGVYLISGEPALLEDLNPCFDYAFVKPLDEKQLRRVLNLPIKHNLVRNAQKSKKSNCKNFIHDKIPSELIGMLPKLVKEVDQVLCDLEQDVNSVNLEDLTASLHKLKGSFMLFQLTGFVQQVDQLAKLMNSQQYQQAATLMQQMREELHQQADSI